jgi:hypothetical protein
MTDMTHPSGDQFSVEACLVGFEERRQRLLGMVAVTKADEAAGALALLELGRDVADANRVLREEVSGYFERPDPRGNHHRGEVDFYAFWLCTALRCFEPQLEPATCARIRAFVAEHDFCSCWNSENHHLIFRTTRLLISERWPELRYAAYGRQAAETRDEDLAWLRRFIVYRARFGWGEFDSPIYLVPSWDCLCALHDHAQDPVLRRLAAMMLDLLLADMAVDSLQGMYCGAHGRMYPQHALDHADEDTLVLQALHFGQGEPHFAHSANALLCSFRPSLEVVRLAHGRRAPYRNRERKHLHNMGDVLPERPLPGSLRKLTWWTPGHVLGCVQHQDAYPDAESGLYAHHQQHEWDLSFAAGGAARIFTHHPGIDGEHNHWTGDRLCGCGRFLQHREALLAIYDIAPDQPCQFIHAHVPRAAFDQVVEEDGWLFVRSGGSAAGLRLLSTTHPADGGRGYTWTTEGPWSGREVVAPGARHGVVCEVATIDGEAGFAAFRRELAGNRLHFDRERLALAYHSRRNGVLTLARGEPGLVDGVPLDLDHGTYDCPWLRSAWGSREVGIGEGSDRLVLDFPRAAAGG